MDAQAELGDIGVLYRVHGARLWRAVFAYAGDRELASDAVAEAFAQCIGRGEAVAAPLPWIWKAAFRIAAGELKLRAASTLLRDATYDMEIPDPDLGSALARLPKRIRAVVVLHYFAGFTAPEIGAILGSTAATVRVQLFQARSKLRTLLGGEGD